MHMYYSSTHFHYGRRKLSKILSRDCLHFHWKISSSIAFVRTWRKLLVPFKKPKYLCLIITKFSRDNLAENCVENWKNCMPNIKQRKNIGNILLVSFGHKYNIKTSLFAVVIVLLLAMFTPNIPLGRILVQSCKAVKLYFWHTTNPLIIFTNSLSYMM